MRKKAAAHRALLLTSTPAKKKKLNNGGTPFKPGNEIWKLNKNRAAQLPHLTFPTPEDLWASACEYFQWATDHPLIECKVANSAGEPIIIEIPKLRAMTLVEMRVYIGIAQSTWHLYSTRPEFSDVCQLIADIIYAQKFTGAAAELFNATIIARDLGLREKQDTELTGRDGAPLDHSYTVTFVEPGASGSKVPS